mgnify:CR=1 FL=1|jgi:hypothetical protein
MVLLNIGNKISFLNKNDCKYFFSDVIEKNANMMNLVELEVRSGINNANVNDYYNKVINSFRNFTDNEIYFLKKAVNKASDLLKDFKQLQQLEWKLAILDGDTDWGYPYTLNDAIILRPINLKNDTSYTLIKTLIHEITHVFQRMNIGNVEGLYNKWNFYRMQNIVGYDNIKYIQGIPSILINKGVLNPDGVDMWGYKMNKNTFFISTIIVKDGNIFPIGMKILLKDNRLHFIKMDAMRNIQWYNNMLDGVEQKYHPNEIMACIVSSIAMKENLYKSNLNYDSTYRNVLYNSLIEWGDIY